MDLKAQLKSIRRSKQQGRWLRFLSIATVIVLFSFVVTGCLARVPIKNENHYSKVMTPNGSLLPVSIDYLWPSGKAHNQFTRYLYRDKIRALLVQDGYEFIYYDKSVNIRFSHQIAVTITEKWFGDAGLLDIFTGLSLGAIPSYGRHRDFISVEVALLEGTEILEKLNFSVDLDVYAGWIFLPFYPWLNQNEIDVVSGEIHKSINQLLANNQIFIAAPEKKSFLKKPNIQMSAIEKEYLEQINSDSIATVIIAAKHIVRGGLMKAPALYEVINRKILDNYLDIDENHSVDEIAWLCKALATSGDEKYKETLYKVAKDGDGFHLRRHARDSMNAIDIFAVGGVGFKGFLRR